MFRNSTIITIKICIIPNVKTYIDIVSQIQTTIDCMIAKQTLMSKWTKPCAQRNVVVFKIRTPVPRMKQNDPIDDKKRKIAHQR